MFFDYLSTILILLDGFILLHGSLNQAKIQTELQNCLYMTCVIRECGIWSSAPSPQCCGHQTLDTMRKSPPQSGEASSGQGKCATKTINISQETIHSMSNLQFYKTHQAILGRNTSSPTWPDFNRSLHLDYDCIIQPIYVQEKSRQHFPKCKYRSGLEHY